jgi:DNA polymerase III alpha subunit
MLKRGDIDIDFASRDAAQRVLGGVSASIMRDGKISKHNTGVYFHAVPVDPITGLCSIGYEEAEDRGFFKIDLLNVGVYDMIRDEAHLLEMMSRPIDWTVFEDVGFVSGLFHLGNHADLTARLKPKSIEHLAMVLALIRPGKKHLQQRCESNGFDPIADEIWTKTDGDEYFFKKSHAVGYAVLVYVHANLLLDRLVNSAIMEA